MPIVTEAPSQYSAFIILKCSISEHINFLLGGWCVSCTLSGVGAALVAWMHPLVLHPSTHHRWIESRRSRPLLLEMLLITCSLSPWLANNWGMCNMLCLPPNPWGGRVALVLQRQARGVRRTLTPNRTGPAAAVLGLTTPAAPRGKSNFILLSKFCAASIVTECCCNSTWLRHLCWEMHISVLSHFAPALDSGANLWIGDLIFLKNRAFCSTLQWI